LGGRRPPGVLIEKKSEWGRGNFMREIFVLYTFVGLMALNLFATFLYIVGLSELKASARRAYQSYMAKPR
jgi:hypothetical protein